MGVLEIVGLAAGALVSLAAIAALVGFVWARFRTSADETTSRVWKEEAEAQKARADRLEASLNSLAVRVERLEHENETLRDLATGKGELIALRADIGAGFARLEGLLTVGGSN